MADHTSNRMTRDELVAEVERLGPWFHAIDLGQGVITKTKSSSGELDDHPLGEWQVIKECLPADLAGKSLLDVGCNAGFFAVEAKRRGAARVLGVDVQRHHVRQACFVRRALGLGIEFRRLSVYDLSGPGIGQFDITLALGLLYHCKHLVQALENLFYVTRELLIIETAIYPTPEPLERVRSNLGLITPDVARGRVTHLLAYIENPPESKEAVYNWFLPSVASMIALLKNVGFKEIEARPYQDDRAVFVCRKERSEADSASLNSLAAALTLEYGETNCHAGDVLRFSFHAKNTGLGRWLAGGEAGTGKGAVRLGAHLLRDDEEEAVWDYGRGELPRDVALGEAVRVEIKLQAPDRPGRYCVEFDMVSEHLSWFEDLGSSPIRHDLHVAPPSPAEG